VRARAESARGSCGTVCLLGIVDLKKLQGRAGYRLRIGDWRVIYELHDDRLVMLVLEVGPRGGIY
jgi:mRNA-degrading endonuclease RelE of RelBE toxin-antitoxin system